MQQFVVSQTITEIRQMRLEAIEVFDSYSAVMSSIDVPNSYVKDNFMSLFEDNALIYNDILPVNSSQYISAEEYYEKYVKLIKTYSKFSDLELSMPYEGNGKWYIKLNFKKLFNLTYKYHNLSYPQYSLEDRKSVV